MNSETYINTLTIYRKNFLSLYSLLNPILFLRGRNVALFKKGLRYLLFMLGWPILSLLPDKIKFTFIHRLNMWGNQESASGDGSTFQYTKNLHKELPKLFTGFNINSLFDSPCGDYNWFRFINRDNLSYIGGDIVKSLIDKNNSLYGNSKTVFIHFDIRNMPFPKADLWLCRDCMFHLSNTDIMKSFENFCNSDIPYVLTTSHTEVTENIELQKKGFRLLNLQIYPYLFPEPLIEIEDWVPGFPKRILGLWKKEDVETVVKQWNNASETK